MVMKSKNQSAIILLMMKWIKGLWYKYILRRDMRLGWKWVSSFALLDDRFLDDR